MLGEVSGKAAMKTTQVYSRHKCSRDCRAGVNDVRRRGRPSTSTNDENIERVRNDVRSDRRKSM
jgi:hypothetical protein